MFKTARFKVHNPSRHKATLLLYALTHYHNTLKSVLETALSTPGLLEQVSIPDKKGRARINRFAVAHLVRQKSPKNWELAPLREYLIGDVTAMLLSHFKKLEKGKNESNPPTLSSLTPLSDEQATAAYREFTETLRFPIKEQHQAKIEEALSKGKVRVAERMERTYQNYATSRAAGEILRRIDGPLPRPIEFTHTEFGRGALLGRRGNNYYLLVRLFSEGHRYREQKTLDEHFVDWRTRELIGCRKYPGVILPLEFDRDFHDHEYFQNGRPQSAKLLARKDDQGRLEFYVHIAFEFKRDPVQPISILGIDRGAAKIGAATVIDQQARVVASGIDMEGAAFSAEMARLRERIAQHQRKGLQKGRVLRLRGRKADNIIGEYANRIVELAAKQRSQIVIERIDARSMARFLTQSQFGKLKSSLRAGGPAYHYEGAPPKLILLGWGSSVTFTLNRIPIRSRLRPVHSDSISTTPSSPVMHVAQFLDTLLRCPHIEIIITRLPEMLPPGDQLAGHRLLHGLQRPCQGAALRLAYQQINVFRHDHIAGDVKAVLPAGLFQRLLKQPLGLRAAQQR